MPTKIPQATSYSVPVVRAVWRAAGIPEPFPEFTFHHDRAWRFDFAWPHAMVALEVEGGVFGHGKPCPVCHRKPGGAHSSIQNILRDLEKYSEAACLGWRIIRVQPDHLLGLLTVGLIKRALAWKL